MSEQDNRQSSTKQRRSRKTNTANYLNGKQAPALQRPANDDTEALKDYWKAQGQPWRTEREIDLERQRYLDERRRTTSDIEKGIYPFKEIELSRADIEWLLATHENRVEPINWNERDKKVRISLNLLGANLHGQDLHELPLAEAGVHLEGADLSGAHLEGTNLSKAYLMGAIFSGAHLEGADLSGAHLEGTNFSGAHLEGADLSGAHLEGAFISQDILHYLEFFPKSSLKVIGNALVTIKPATLSGSFFDVATNIKDIVLGDEINGFVFLVDIHWGGANVAVIDWKPIKYVGEEYEANLLVDRDAMISGFQIAVRANRQLSLVLQSQGLNEHAARFAYHAKVLQRQIAGLQAISVHKDEIASLIISAGLISIYSIAGFINATYKLLIKSPPPLFVGEILNFLLLPPIAIFVFFVTSLGFLKITLRILVEQTVHKERAGHPALPFFVLVFGALILLLPIIPLVYLPPALWFLWNQKDSLYGILAEDLFSLIFLIVCGLVIIRRVIKKLFPNMFRRQKKHSRRVRKHIFSQVVLSYTKNFFIEIGDYIRFALSLMLDVLAGYGYKPWRSVAAYLCVIMFFDILYYVCGQTVGPPLSPIGSLVLSVSSFHGRGFFPGGGITLDDPLTVLAALEAVVGLFIEISFIAAFTQRFLGK